MFDKILMALKAMFDPGQTDMTKGEISAALDKHSPGSEWRTSIVDLMKALELDSSLPARRQLALELGYQKSFNGTGADNQWLHERVLEEVVKHGIKIP